MMDEHKCFETGTLVRFLHGDEYLSANEERLGFGGDFEDFALEIQEELLKEMQPSGIRSYLTLATVKDVDAHAEDWEDDGDIIIPFGSKGMVLAFWKGSRTIWQKILVGEKTVWTDSWFLVKLTDGNGEEDDLP